MRFDWLVRKDRVIYTLVAAGIWHASGLVMAIMLSGLRGIDQEIWKATRIDGIPAWCTYIFVVIPMLKGSFATATILMATTVVRLYDLTVAMTNGGPGIASEVPAKFVMDNLFERQNIGLRHRGRDLDAHHRGRHCHALTLRPKPSAAMATR